MSAAPFQALSPVQRDLYEFAVRQVRATGFRLREVDRFRPFVFRMIFGDRELSRLDLHRQSDPVRKRVKRIERGGPA